MHSATVHKLQHNLFYSASEINVIVIANVGAWERQSWKKKR